MKQKTELSFMLVLLLVLTYGPAQSASMVDSSDVDVPMAVNRHWPLSSTLRDVFSVGTKDAAEILKSQGLSALDTARVLKDVFALNEWDAAQVLKNIGYGCEQTYYALTEFYQLDDAIMLEQILGAAGYSPEEYLPFTAFQWVQRFAPVLGFDSEYKGLPMSAQTYFEDAMQPVLEGDTITFEWKRWMENTDYWSLSDVPTYFKTTVREGRLVIEYWWFYGWQQQCCYNLAKGCQPEGSHHADWEHIKVTLNGDRTRVDAVTYYYHADWYTRKRGHFGEIDGRPYVYVGKTAHGSYHVIVHLVSGQGYG